MPTYTRRRAERVQLRLKMALAGPSRSGKTLTALYFAGALGGTVCVIDSDHRNAEQYVGRPHVPTFDIIDLEDFTPEDYIAAIEAAKGVDILVIDTVSKEWISTLAIKDAATAASPSQNAYTEGWGTATPRHNAFIAAMLGWRGHLIVTVRERVKHVLEQNAQGKMEPRKIGLKPIQREDFEFEFQILGNLTMAHVITLEARDPDLDGLTARSPGPDFMDPIKVWLGTGLKVYTREEVLDAAQDAGCTTEEIKAQIRVMAPGIKTYDGLSARQKADLYRYFTELARPQPTLVTSPNGAPTPEAGTLVDVTKTP